MKIIGKGRNGYIKKWKLFGENYYLAGNYYFEKGGILLKRWDILHINNYFLKGKNYNFGKGWNNYFCKGGNYYLGRNDYIEKRRNNYFGKGGNYYFGN